MKKRIVTSLFAIACLLGSSAFIIKYQNGIAGYTGAPGEGSCNSCHGNASSPSSGITISSTPAFTLNEFVPGTTYNMTVTIAASGFNKFGFGCEILDQFLINAGMMQNQGPGVKFLFSSGRKNAVHSTPKSGTGQASFTFDWVAPSVGDTATIYAAGNAVNGNGSTSGDFPLPPVLMQLKAQAPVSEPTAVKENSSFALHSVSVYPNPAKETSTLAYRLAQARQVTVELVDLSGKTVKTLVNEKQAPGAYSQAIDLRGVAGGIYFVKVSGNGLKAAQKMLMVEN